MKSHSSPPSDANFLQWGRALGARRIRTSCSHRPRSKRLQWGRALGARRIGGEWPDGSPLCVGLQWGRALGARRMPIPTTAAPMTPTLQWGRALGARRIYLPAPLRTSCCGPSMGPRFGGAENRTKIETRARKTLPSMGPRFGGAENLPSSLRGITNLWLQWGRALGARRIALARLVDLRPSHASMGPRFGGAENKEARVRGAEQRQASMGPRFGGAENSQGTAELQV